MTLKQPANPFLVLASAIVLPGAGQVLNREPVRGLMFLFFILLLGAFTLKTASPEVSIIGKLSGGIFVYAMAVFDAYQRARVRTEVGQHAATREGAPPQG
jgi:NADH:ubiquinone oxidoreductase subunit 6 (subunit J)